MRPWTHAHIEQCNLMAVSDPAAMRTAALLAVMSIQQAWHIVPVAMADLVKHGRNSRFLWGFKRDTYDYLIDESNMDHLYGATMMTDNPVDLLDLWSTVPGLGLAKAGFVVQLTRGMVGCVDRHNADAYDVPPSQLVFPKGRMTMDAQRHKLEQYVHLTNSIGGSAFMWEQWCIMIAAKYPRSFESAQHVSRQHVDLMELAL
jgi:hypothetical protein